MLSGCHSMIGGQPRQVDEYKKESSTNKGGDMLGVIMFSDRGPP